MSFTYRRCTLARTLSNCCWPNEELTPSPLEGYDTFLLDRIRFAATIDDIIDDEILYIVAQRKVLRELYHNRNKE